MTDNQLAAVVSRARVILLDFDGPVCSLFAGYPAPKVAADLRTAVEALFGELPALASVDGPLQLLRWCADNRPPLVARYAAEQLRDLEVTAAASAEPTPGGHDVLDAARTTGRPVAIVSNNSVEAVTAYLERHKLRDRVDLVVGRHEGLDPQYLKPNPFLLGRALDRLEANPDETVLIGDSISDIEAALAAGAPAIGYANKPGKRQAQSNAGASAIATTMIEVVDALSKGMAHG